MLAEIDVPGHAESWYCSSTLSSSNCRLLHLSNVTSFEHGLRMTAVILEPYILLIFVSNLDLQGGRISCFMAFRKLYSAT